MRICAPVRRRGAVLTLDTSMGVIGRQRYWSLARSAMPLSGSLLGRTRGHLYAARALPVAAAPAHQPADDQQRRRIEHDLDAGGPGDIAHQGMQHLTWDAALGQKPRGVPDAVAERRQHI